jgi:hypothetical protein
VNRMLPLLAAVAFSVPILATGQRDVATSGVQQRGSRVEPPDTPVVRGHRYVVAIGIDHYRNWPILGTAVSDATGFAKLFTEQLGFEYAAEPLTENNATRDKIESLIDDDLRSKLKPEDDLIIFFAGHGTTRYDKIGEQTTSVGFLVPFEARSPGVKEYWSDYLKIDEFLRIVSTLPSKHILVILDSCHSGMALGSQFSPRRAGTRFQQDLANRVSRTVITSAASDQLATDVGPVPGHSLFTGLMMRGLLTGKADAFDQGFVTATQLGAYTQHEVGIAAESRQTPRFGGFDLDDGGELIIPLRTATASNGRTIVSASSAQLSSSALPEIHEIDIAKGKMLYQDPFTFQQATAVAKYFQDRDGFDDPGTRFQLRKASGVTDFTRTIVDEEDAKALEDGNGDSDLIWMGREIAPLIGGLPIELDLVNKAGKTLRQLAVLPFVGLYGVLADAAGAVIAGAKVTATNETDGYSITLSSSPSGRFEFPDLGAGTYTVQAQAPGFKTHIRKGIRVDGQGNTNAGVTMQIGSGSD